MLKICWEGRIVLLDMVALVACSIFQIVNKSNILSNIKQHCLFDVSFQEQGVRCFQINCFHLSKGRLYKKQTNMSEE